MIGTFTTLQNEKVRAIEYAVVVETSTDVAKEDGSGSWKSILWYCFDSNIAVDFEGDDDSELCTSVLFFCCDALGTVWIRLGAPS